MTADRFDEVERICLEALEQAPDRRTAFLDEACRDDADLRAQVDRLLAGASNAEQFLETPPAEPVSLVLRAGDRLGPYEVVARIGAGGMGEVYRARDTRLDREVALKILGGHLAADPLVTGTAAGTAAPASRPSLGRAPWAAGTSRLPCERRCSAGSTS